MNNPNPFIPQGSLLDQKNRKRARVKVAVYSIFAINILVISPLLIQGCSRSKDTTADNTVATPDTNNVAPPDTNTPPPLPMANSTSAPPVVTNVAPPPPPPPPVVETPTTKEYVVMKNDSFYSIAKKFGVRIKDVQSANPTVVPTKLKVGQKLEIPAGATGGGSSVSDNGGGNSSMGGGETSVYVVKSNDSLTKIAKANGTTIKALRAANELKTDKIKVGQKLKIPSRASAPVETAAPAPAPAPMPTTAPPPLSPQPGNGR